MKCVFFDRDGIINRSPPEGGYVLSVDAFLLDPVFPGILRRTTALGYAAVVVTNQRCVARGLVSLETIDAMHSAMRRRLRDQHGLDLLDVLVCPHHPGSCQCRKPLPGMLIEAAGRHAIDLKQSWMIGDRLTDVEAGRRAGCRTILVRAGGLDPAVPPDERPDVVCRDLNELALRIDFHLANP